MDVHILSSNPGSGGFVLGPLLPSFTCEHRSEKIMADAAQQFSLDGLAEEETDSVLVCEEEKEVSRRVSRYLPTLFIICGTSSTTIIDDLFNSFYFVCLYRLL